MFRLLFVALLLLTAVACKNRAPDATMTTARAETPVKLWFSLKREPCRGMCPKYTLQVFTDGRVRFHGERFTELTGVFEKTLNDVQRSKLTVLFQQPDFFQYNDRYEDTLVADIPGTYVTLVQEGRTKTVYARDGVPESLQRLIRSLEEVVDLKNGYTLVNDPVNSSDH